MCLTDVIGAKLVLYWCCFGVISVLYFCHVGAILGSLWCFTNVILVIQLRYSCYCSCIGVILVLH